MAPDADTLQNALLAVILFADAVALLLWPPRLAAPGVVLVTGLFALAAQFRELLS